MTHLSYLIAVLSLSPLLTPTFAISEENKQCIQRYNETLSNDFLLGSWFMVYRFTLFGTLVPSESCEVINFWKASAEKIEEYKAKYNKTNVPYSFDDNPVIKNDSYWEGIVTGHKVVKFYLLNPDSKAVIANGYAATVYKPLNDKYIMQMECALRENVISLLSRDKGAPLEEIQEFALNVPQLRRLVGQRFCAEYNNSTIKNSCQNYC